MAFYAWRGDLVYGIYQRMGGSRSRAELSELLDQETDVSDYKDMVGGWMEKLLEEEGQTPNAAVLDSLKHPVGRMTWDRWVDGLVAEVDEAEAAEAGAAAAEERAEPQRRRARGKRAPLPHETAEVLGKSVAQAEDPLEAALAELEKVEERPPANKVSQKKPKAAPKKRPSSAPGAGTNQCVGRSPMPCIYNLQRPGARGRYNSSAAARRRQCLFCDSAWLEKACSNAKGRSNVLSNLKKFRPLWRPHLGGD